MQPEQEGGERFAHLLRVSGARDYLSLSADYGIGVYPAPEHLHGHTVSALDEGNTDASPPHRRARRPRRAEPRPRPRHRPPATPLVFAGPRRGSRARPLTPERPGYRGSGGRRRHGGSDGSLSSSTRTHAPVRDAPRRRLARRRTARPMTPPARAPRRHHRPPGRLRPRALHRARARTTPRGPTRAPCCSASTRRAARSRR